MSTKSHILGILVICALAAVCCRGADIQRGITFQDGQRITASQLHELVDDAVIVPGFMLNKPTATSLGAGDSLLVYSSSAAAFFKISGNTLLYNNTGFITSQPEKLLPAANDFFLIYDGTGTVLSKVSVGNVWSNNFALLPAIPGTNVTLAASVPVVAGGSNGVMTLANLFLLFPYTTLFTNLPVRAHPTNFDELMLSASDDGTNFFTRQISLAAFFTNLPPATFLTNAVPTNGATVSTNITFAGYEQLVTNGGSTNGVVVQFTLQSLLNWETNFLAASYRLPQTVQLGDFPISNALNYVNASLTNSVITNTPQSVRWALVCTNTEDGYFVNDEITADAGLADSSDNSRHPTWGASATNVWFSFQPAGVCQLVNKTNPVAPINLTAATSRVRNFVLRCYVTRFNNP